VSHQRWPLACLKLAVLLTGVAAAASCSTLGSADPAPKSKSPEAVPVTVATATTRTVPIEIKTFGSVETAATVTVQAEISAILTSVKIQKGQSVKKGDLLFTLDERSFEAAVKQADAVLARDKVQAKNAADEAQRIAELVKKGIASRSESEKAQADADALSAAIKADEAARDIAKVQLDRCTIHSPINGRVGNILVTEGNIVTANDKALVVIKQMSPIEVFFALSQDELADLRKHLSEGPLKVTASLPGQPDEIETGKLTFVDNALDKTSSTVQLAGTFDNARERLWPGQYVNLVLTLGVEKDAVIIPSRAIQMGRDSRYVFVVRSDGTADMRLITVGRMVGDESIIMKGLAAGETVVTDGHVRLKKGDKVDIKPGETLKAGKSAPAAGQTAAPGQTAPTKTAPGQEIKPPASTSTTAGGGGT
jgi:membrane fusion protein, multidrug efflux system